MLNRESVRVVVHTPTEFQQQLAQISGVLSDHGILVCKPADGYQPHWPGSYNFFEDTLLRMAGVNTKATECNFTENKDGNVKFTLLGLKPKDDALFAKFLNIPLQDVGGEVDGASTFVVSMQTFSKELVPLFTAQVVQYAAHTPHVLKPYLCFDLFTRGIVECLDAMRDYFFQNRNLPDGDAISTEFLRLSDATGEWMDNFVSGDPDKNKLNRAFREKLLQSLPELHKQAEQFSKKFKLDEVATKMVDGYKDCINKMIVYVTPVKPSKPYALAAAHSTLFAPQLSASEMLASLRVDESKGMMKKS